MSVRTTVTIDDDIAARLERQCNDARKGFKEYINEVLRIGLAAMEHEAPATRQPFRTRTLPLGRRLINNFDNTAEVLALAEGEDFR